MTPDAESVASTFLRMAQSRPQAPAIRASQTTLTYEQLRARAVQLARALQGRGVTAGTPVGLFIPRSVESAVAVLGILLAGGYYVPIDPTYPLERRRFIVGDCGASLVLGSSAWGGGAPQLPELKQTVSHLLLESAEVAACSSELLPGADPLASSGADPLLCLVYTSGSTGRPKGVCVTQSGMLGRWGWGWQRYPFAPGEVIAHRSSLNFLDSATELFSGLLQGVPTAIIDPEEAGDLPRLVRTLVAHGATRLTLVPSLLAALLRLYPDLGQRLPKVAIWVSSGEELSLALLRRFRQASPSATLLNLYGSTEVSADVTCAAFSPETPLPQERVPIGAAIGEAELLVLDEARRSVPVGSEGELYIGGPVLCRGYWQRKEEEQARFCEAPGRPGLRLFRSGDRVRLRADGQLEYLGRVDNQVKVNGIRIELEELELAIGAALPAGGMAAAVAVPSAATPDSRRLWLFASPAEVDAEQLRQRAIATLPPSMVPSRFMTLPALPLVPSGKVDRRELFRLAQRIEQQRSDRAQSDAAPQLSEDERWLAELYSGLLGVAPVYGQDCFAALGGDSLALAELQARLAVRELPTLPVALLRDAPLSQVARWLSGREPLPAAAPDAPYELVPAHELDREALTRFACEVFVAREPLCVSLQLTAADMEGVLAQTVALAQRLGLSLVARERGTGELLAFSLVLDWAEQPALHELTLTPPMQRYLGFVDELCGEYERRTLKPGAGQMLDMAYAGSHADVDGFELLHALDSRILAAAAARGYQAAGTLCFHRATARLAELLGFSRQASRALDAYEVDGKRPFAAAAAVHKEAVLMVKELCADGLSFVPSKRPPLPRPPKA